MKFMNQFWPIARQLNRASTTLNTTYPSLKNRQDQTHAIDQWVKAFEPLMTQVAALKAPPIPYVEKFVDGYVEAILLEFEAGKRLNWGLVTNNEAILRQAAYDLYRSGEQETQAFWELNAAVWQYGLFYNQEKDTWY